MDGEIVEKYLRPKAIAESRSSSAWAESTGVWIADPIHGFVAGRIVEEDDSNVLVELEDRRRVTVARTEILSADSARNDRCEDMAEMTELNEATVLNNLRRRYRSSLIYSYSGLFLVAINPYRTLPIYSAEMAQSYAVGESGGNRQDRPPHIFAVAEQAYRSLRQSRANQSILITGESGAGKTENTKRVIQYLVGAASQNKQLRELEQRIMHANPILESFGNAQTLRNNNSSRFVRFTKTDVS